jgi:ABC-2 type transport system ATP-binding protein
MSSIEVNKLHKTYKGALQPSVEDLSFRFQAGTIAGLLGPNGAGKTTTIAMISGLVRASSGDIFVLGQPQRAGNRENIKRIIGVVPQQIALFPQLTAWENLQYFGNLYGFKGSVLQNKITYLLDRFGLMQAAHKKVIHFSGGMKRRTNIIAALLHNPSLLILDEPTAGVDVQSRTMILDFLKEYNQQGNSVLYTSHLLEEAEELCTDVAIVDEGRLVVQGNPQDLIAALPACANLEEVFLHYTGRELRD